MYAETLYEMQCMTYTHILYVVHRTPVFTPYGVRLCVRTPACAHVVCISLTLYAQLTYRMLVSSIIFDISLSLFVRKQDDVRGRGLYNEVDHVNCGLRSIIRISTDIAIIIRYNHFILSVSSLN